MAEPHYIEQSVKVYLDFINGEWVVSPSTMDGHALDESLDGAEAVCEHDNDADRQDCRRAREAADQVSMPTGRELIALLQAADTDD